MKILYIYRHPNLGFSIGKVFRPIEQEMKKKCEVDTLYLPRAGYSFLCLIDNIQALEKKVREKHYDIVHITGTENYLIPFLLKQNVVVTVHDLCHYFQLKGFSKVMYYMANIWPLCFADKITCISESCKQDLLKVLPRVRSKSICIPNAIGEDFSFIEHKFNVEHPRVLHIGIKKQKNLLRSIYALKGINVHLRIIGRITSEVEKLLKKFHFDYSYVYNISDSDLIKEYANADIVNFPSL